MIDGTMLLGIGLIITGGAMLAYCLLSKLCAWADGQADMYRGFDK